MTSKPETEKRSRKIRWSTKKTCRAVEWKDGWLLERSMQRCAVVLFDDADDHNYFLEIPTKYK